MVAASFGVVRHSLENVTTPFKKFILYGTVLYGCQDEKDTFEKGLAVAELVQDEMGRYFWKHFMRDKVMAQEVEIHGMGMV